MKPLKIRFDMDGVLADFFGPVFDLYYEVSGVRYTPDDLKEHEISTLVGKDEYFRRVEPIYNKPGFFAELKPYPGAIEVVNELLDDGHEIEIVTSPTMIRHPATGERVINGQCAAEKFDWIARYLPRLARNVTITKHKANVHGDVLVDDSGHNITPWAEAHPKGLAFVVERPWNARLELPKNAVRCPLDRLQGVLLLKADDEVFNG